MTKPNRQLQSWACRLLSLLTSQASVLGVLVEHWGWLLGGPTAKVHRTHTLQGSSSQASSNEASRGEDPLYPCTAFASCKDLPYPAGSAFLSSSPAAKNRVQGTEQRCADLAYTHFSHQPFSLGNAKGRRNSQGATENTEQQGGRFLAGDACGLGRHLDTLSPVLLHTRYAARP